MRHLNKLNVLMHLMVLNLLNYYYVNLNVINGQNFLFL
jgi:hypothetical protein